LYSISVFVRKSLEQNFSCCFGLKSTGIYEGRGKVGKNELCFNTRKNAQQKRAVIPPYIGVLNVIAARLKNLFYVLKKIGARSGLIVVNRDRGTDAVNGSQTQFSQTMARVAEIGMDYGEPRISDSLQVSREDVEQLKGNETLMGLHKRKQSTSDMALASAPLGDQARVIAQNRAGDSAAKGAR
jgi:hypothetical protein